MYQNYPLALSLITQTDLDIQGSHVHHACMQSSCAWTMIEEVHEDTFMHNNVKRCLLSPPNE